MTSNFYHHFKSEFSVIHFKDLNLNLSLLNVRQKDSDKFYNLLQSGPRMSVDRRFYGHEIKSNFFLVGGRWWGEGGVGPTGKG